MELNSLLKEAQEDMTTWIDFKDIEICVRYVDKVSFQKLVDRCKKQKWERHQPVEKVDQSLLERAMAGLIADWKGLTVAKAAKLLPIEIGTQDPDAVVECTETNRITMIQHCYGLEDFLIDTVTNLQLFRIDKLEQEVKN